MNKQGDIVRALLVKGAVSDSANRDFETALHVATRKGYEEIVAQLVEMRPYAVNKHRWHFGGWATVHLASIIGHTGMVRNLKLLADGVDVHCLDSCGLAPLHHAVEKADAVLVELLKRMGARRWDDIPVGCKPVPPFG